MQVWLSFIRSIIYMTKKAIVKKQMYMNNNVYEAYIWGQSYIAQGDKCDCKRDWLWVRSSLEEIKYLYKCMFPFLRYGVETKRSIEFRYSKSQCLQNSTKYEERSVLALGSLCLFCVRDTAWNWFNFYMNNNIIVTEFYNFIWVNFVY